MAVKRQAKEGWVITPETEGFKPGAKSLSKKITKGGFQYGVG